MAATEESTPPDMPTMTVRPLPAGWLTGLLDPIQHDFAGKHEGSDVSGQRPVIVRRVGGARRAVCHRSAKGQPPRELGEGLESQQWRSFS